MNAWHIGLSVVATDVGGGFSIGLGGLGFVMGLSGSWMLFTGLLGAWISGVWLIPRIYKIKHHSNEEYYFQLHYILQKQSLIYALPNPWRLGYLLSLHFVRWT